MCASDSAFKEGDSVKVRNGVMCPDYKDLCIAGWQGRVIDVGETDDGEVLVDIAWDSVTLKAMPGAYIEGSEEDDCTEMTLLADEVELASPRDSEDDAEAAREELRDRYSWLGEGEEGRRIHAVVSGADPDDDMALLDAWETHLRKTLKFPFTAKVSEYQEHPPPHEGDKMEVMRIVDMDDLVGLLVRAKHGNKEFVFPLCDLTVVDKKSPNYQPVKDYRVWFANR